MAIPDNIIREDIEKAIKFIDANGIPWHREAISYYVTSENKSYPVKYVLSVANKIKNNIELDSESFNSIEARNFLLNLGFEIISERRGETKMEYLSQEDIN